jgi:hypothetical protein
VISFAEARAIVAASPEVAEFYGDGFTVRTWGWHNAELIVVDAQGADGREMMDAPHTSVDKQTGELTLHYGLLGSLPARDLTPLGHRPLDSE